MHLLTVLNILLLPTVLAVNPLVDQFPNGQIQFCDQPDEKGSCISGPTKQNQCYVLPGKQYGKKNGSFRFDFDPAAIPSKGTDGGCQLYTGSKCDGKYSGQGTLEPSLGRDYTTFMCSNLIIVNDGQIF